MTENQDLIFSLSGIRGIFGKALTLETARAISHAFGLWLKSKEKRVIVGRDTRPSSVQLSDQVIKGLITSGCEVYNAEISPTPAIIYEKNKLGLDGGIIISGSHNPPEWNALKLISERTFIGHDELEEVLIQLESNSIQVNIEAIKLKAGLIKEVNANADYTTALLEFLNKDRTEFTKSFKVILDTGAGAGNYVTPAVLRGLGCEVITINDELDENDQFPREIEPIEENLQDLIIKVWKEKADIGFAHDCDADRLAIVGNDYKCYFEDVGLAIITDHYLEEMEREGKKVIFVTNVASSMRFEALAIKHGAELIRTPVGERFLAEKMHTLQRFCSDSEEIVIFGGEGSCGGIINPSFNLARDGIYAAAKIIDILSKTNQPISNLVSKLPKYYSHRAKINLKSNNVPLIINKLKRELYSEGEKVDQIDQDLRFGEEREWFVLIHPSNTEPVIRIISEAKRDSLARVYCETTAELVKMVIDKVNS